MLRALGRRRRADDEGFTLVEVLVALTLLTLVAISAGAFMIRSVHANRALQDRQGATQVAREVFESLKWVSPNREPDPTTGKLPTSALVIGRSKDDVTAQWSALTAAGTNTGDTYTGSGSTSYDQDVYDPTATAGSAPRVPFGGRKTISKTVYDYTVAIGACLRPRGSTDCGVSGTGDELYRVIITVKWSTGAGRTAQSLTTASLVDATGQPVFNINRKPYAYDDTADAYSGTPVSIPVLSNDKGSWAMTGAVTVTKPGNGTATVDRSSNSVIYTPNSTFTGQDTFTYKAQDTNGNSTGYATVKVTVHPDAVADNPATVTNSWTNPTFTVAVVGNDRGVSSGSTVTITGAPGGGATAAVSGQAVDVTAPLVASAATYTFTYTVTTNGLTSKPATATLQVNPPAAPSAKAATLQATVGQPAALDLQGVSGPAGVTYSSTDPGVTFTGSTLNYTPAAAGTRTIAYTVTDKLGRSASSTVTLTVSSGK